MRRALEDFLALVFLVAAAVGIAIAVAAPLITPIH